MQPIVTDGVAWSVGLSVGGCVTIVCRAKTAEPAELSFGVWTRLGPRKYVLDGVHIGVTWRIRLNRPCVAAMQPFCQITLTTCYTYTP